MQAAPIWEPSGIGELGGSSVIHQTDGQETLDTLGWKPFGPVRGTRTAGFELVRWVV